MKHSSSTYVAVAIENDDIAAAQEAAKTQAIERLGGDDVKLIDLATHGNGPTKQLGTTWLREWEVPDEEHAAVLEKAAATRRRRIGS